MTRDAAPTRVGPGLGFPTAGTLVRGSDAQATCQTQSAKAVRGTHNWYGLSGGSYVSQADAVATAVGSAAPAEPLPKCDRTGWSAQYTPAVANESLRARAGPGLAYPVQGNVAKQASLELVCRTQSDVAINGSPTWYRLSSGDYVAGSYTTIAPGGARSTVPMCEPASLPPPPATPQGARTTGSPAAATSVSAPSTATATEALKARRGPETTSPVVRTLPARTPLDVACQTSPPGPASLVGDNTTWLRLRDGTYVSKRYVTTPADVVQTRTPDCNDPASRRAGPPNTGPIQASQSGPSTLGITSTVTQTGTHFANWVPNDTTVPTGSLTSSAPQDPGDDYNGSNDWVRTLDVTTVHIVYSVSPASAAGSGPILLTANIKGGPAFLQEGFVLTSGTGGNCPGPGGFQINANRTGFTCDIGTLQTAQTFPIDVFIVAPMSTPNGNAFTLMAMISESGNPLPNQMSATSTPVKVSAGPRFELVKKAVGEGSARPGPSGSSGQGITQRWAIGVAVLSSDPYGLSALPDPIVFTDQVGATPAAGVWLDSCFPNGAPNWPGQVGSPPAPAGWLVAPSPSCSQATKPNGTISVSLAGIDYSRLTTPPPPGLLGYFELDTWVSNVDITAAGGAVHVCDAVGITTAGQDTAKGWTPGSGTGTWHPVDVSGSRNLLGASEPIANNGACLRVMVPAPTGVGGWNKLSDTPAVNGAGVLKTSTTRSKLLYYNQGNGALAVGGGYICDKWDDSRFSPVQLTPATFPPWNPMVTVEWGKGNWGSGSTAPDPEKWYQQATNDCGNNSLFTPSAPVPLSSISSIVPPSGVNAVRITFIDPLPGPETVIIYPTWTMAPSVVPGEELRNYAAAWFPEVKRRETSDCPGGTPQTMRCDHLVRGDSAGNFSHWWTTIPGSVQVVKSRPDAAAYAPGGTLTWGISARGVAPVGGATGSTTDVKIVDTLPPGFTYVPGSTVGVAESTCAQTNPQVCTWALGNLPWTTVPTVKFTFQTSISAFEPSGTYTNTARGQTPDDPTLPGLPSADKRVSPKDVQVIQASGAAIDKSVSPASPGPGDTVVYTLRYGNPSSSSVVSMDAIDILPFDGDPRGSQIGPGSFTLTGITRSSKVPPEEIWVSDANPAGLDAIDGADGLLDPTAPGVGPVPSAQWPCKVSPVGLLTDATGGPCPFALAQVTAVRFIGTGTQSKPFLPKSSGPYSINLTYKLGTCITGSKVANSWLAQFSGLLPIRFPAQTAAASGCPPANPGAGGGPTPVPTGRPPAAGATPPVATTPPVGTVHPGGTHRAGLIALTGTEIARLSILALLALVVGLMLLASSKRRERRVAFAQWVDHASIDELLCFAREPQAAPLTWPSRWKSTLMGKMTGHLVPGRH